MSKKMKLRTKMLISFLIVGLVPFAAVSIISLNSAGNALSEQAFNQLEAVRGIKKAQIEQFFNERKGDMGVLVEIVNTVRKEAFSKLKAIQKIKNAQLHDYFEALRTQLRVFRDDPYAKNALLEFNRVFEEGGNRIDTPEWNTLAKKYDTRMKGINEDNGWYDLFLISTGGDIVYTATRESDLGMSIPDSGLQNSPIGKAFRKAQSMSNNSIALSDLEPYSPSAGAPAGFMMARVLDESGTHAGYVALQLPLDKINKIMLRRSGMGKTGESYLVGQDFLMRSDSYLDPEGHSVAASFKNNTKADTEAVREALAGKEDHKVIMDYNGNPVLSAWEAVDLGSGVRWAMMSEIDVAEAFSPVDDQGKEFFAKYKEAYGYYDLFLINPDGYIFYTVTKESDYQTNIVNGKYSSSNLGKLIRKVMKSNQYGLADFEPYAPSNGEPASFIAQPVINQGKVEVVVALQLSLDAINAIMKQRDGMGKTGETYLVGQDKLMRSDSYLDPDNHSVAASFANPGMGSVDTRAAREALAGKTGSEIIIDYNGNPVLSAYTPLKIGDTTWALLAEIDEAEAFAVIKNLKWLVGIIAIFGIAGILAVAFFSTKSITVAISKIIDRLSDGSDQVSSASDQISQSSQQLASGASEQASSLEQSSSALEQVASQTKKNAENASTSAEAVQKMSIMVKQTAENARMANKLADESKAAVGDGAKSMEKIATSMGEIKTGSDKITDIIEVINEITHQTKMLATNAAIEAARAGDQGKGFAVVADEVSKLAENSKTSAKEIGTLIKESALKAKAGSEMAEKGQEVMKDILEKSNKVAEIVSEITSAAVEQDHKVTEVDHMVESINKASKEQADGLDQVTQAITQMDTVTQQNASNSEETASAAEELSAQSQGLKDIVKELEVLVDGSSALKAQDRDYATHEKGDKQPPRGNGHHKAHKTLTPAKSKKLINTGHHNSDKLVIGPSDEIPMRDDFKEF